MATAGTNTIYDDFRRPQTYSTTPGHNGWTFVETGTLGTPTCVNTEDGCVLTLTSDSEVQVATLYHNDVETFPLEDGIQWIEWSAMVSGIDANTDVVFGVSTAQNNTLDTVQEAAWFRVAGADSTSNLVAETDDNTTNNDDKATGATIAGVIRRMKIDFRSGLDDVRFFVDGSRRASATTFDMQAATAGLLLQPIVQLQKSTGTGTASVSIRSVEIKYIYSY